MVQGVGFRPYVFRLANAMGIHGTVNNSSDGVHILATEEAPVLQKFYQQVIQHPPENAIITWHNATTIQHQTFDAFAIIESEDFGEKDLMVTPDLGLCESCKKELLDKRNRRYDYPFITCLSCGPRYSIIQGLPYDRHLTSMDSFVQCEDCSKEYHDPHNSRYYSQTNSCNTCGIQLQLLHHTGVKIADKSQEIFEKINGYLKEGKIIAVKGIGGFLLICDASNEASINALRARKKRPTKPLALLYPNLALLETDTDLCDEERNMLQSTKAPIVLCRLKKHPKQHLPLNQLAPGLNRIGAMLPYAPILQLITDVFEKPLVATSGNISGCPIIFTNEEALTHLSHIADYLLLNNRDIVTPQDDSVIQWSAQYKLPIMLRRSRGWAPNYHPVNLPGAKESLLAMGSELKGSFAISHRQKCYVSQYLGDQGYFDAQQSYKQTLQHLSGLLEFQPDRIFIDKHPGYEISKYGQELAEQKDIPAMAIQHHEAHVAAVLAENNLLNNNTPLLGVAWDGTGYGDDGKIWGGEFFRYYKGGLKRIAHLDYFPLIMGDKMSREPRLSALSIAHHIPAATKMLEQKFNADEWTLYNAILNMPATVLSTSSMGRLLDGIASLLGIEDVSNYEGEAAMLLQAMAEKGNTDEATLYTMQLEDGTIKWQPMVEAIIKDLQKNVSVSNIALSVHKSLANLIIQIADYFTLPSIACSGGVMQNALLIDLIKEQVNNNNYTLYLHQQLSPNDESISYGQLAWYHAKQIIVHTKLFEQTKAATTSERYSAIDK